MIFSRCTSLEQQLPGIIEKENRDRTVQAGLMVGLQLGRGSDLIVPGVDEDHLFFHDEYAAGVGERLEFRLVPRGLAIGSPEAPDDRSGRPE
jgi:hypothetical protein